MSNDRRASVQVEGVHSYSQKPIGKFPVDIIVVSASAQDVPIGSFIRIGNNVYLNVSASIQAGVVLTTDVSDRSVWEPLSDKDISDAEVKTKYLANADTNNFDDAAKNKLTGIEVGADVNPSAFLESAVVDGRKLTLTDQDGNEIVFNETGTDITNYLKSAVLSDNGNTLTLTDQANATILFQNTNTQLTTYLKTITKNSGEITIERGGGSTLSFLDITNYLKSASVSNNVLTIKDKDEDVVINVALASIAAVDLNTAKRSFSQDYEDEVDVNTLKRSYPQTEEDKVTANALKVGISTGQTEQLVALPATWVSEASYVIGDQIGSAGKNYISKTIHTGSSILPASDSTNWDAVGSGSGGGGAGSISVDSTSGVTGLTLGTGLSSSITNNVATITASGGSYDTTDVIKSLLLSAAFVRLSKGTEVIGVVPYSGSLAGETSTIYYWKKSDKSWYSDSATTTKIIGF